MECGAIRKQFSAVASALSLLLVAGLTRARVEGFVPIWTLRNLLTFGHVYDRVARLAMKISGLLCCFPCMRCHGIPSWNVSSVGMLLAIAGWRPNLVTCWNPSEENLDRVAPAVDFTFPSVREAEGSGRLGRSLVRSNEWYSLTIYAQAHGFAQELTCPASFISPYAPPNPMRKPDQRNAPRSVEGNDRRPRPGCLH